MYFFLILHSNLICLRYLTWRGLWARWVSPDVDDYYIKNIWIIFNIEFIKVNYNDLYFLSFIKWLSQSIKDIDSDIHVNTFNARVARRKIEKATNSETCNAVNACKQRNMQHATVNAVKHVRDRSTRTANYLRFIGENVVLMTNPR